MDYFILTSLLYNLVIYGGFYMSNLILNDNIIGGSSNDSSDILYTPNDNRAETNVQDELDKINTNLSDLGISEIEFGTSGVNASAQTITFSNTHTSTPDTVVVTAYDGTYNRYPIVTAKSSTSFNVKVTNESGVAGASLVGWIAIWKTN